MTRERNASELFTDLARETSVLVRQEVKLAQIEMTEKATYAAKQAGLVAAGGALAAIALLVLVSALVLGLGEFIPLWASALIVGLVVAAAAAALAYVGAMALKRMDPKPTQTIQSIRETKSWAQDLVR